MAVERYGSKTDVMVKLVLVFFIALLSFSVGTYVGKKFSDNQHKLAQLEPNPTVSEEHDEHKTASADHGSEKSEGHGNDGEEHQAEGHGEREVASVNPDSSEIKPQKALSDDEIAKLAEEFVTDDSKPAADSHGKDPHSEKTHDKNGHDEHPKAKTEDTHDSHHASKDTHEAAKPVAAKVVPQNNHKENQNESHGEVHGSEQKEIAKPAARMLEGHSPIVPNSKTVTNRIPAALPKEVASSAMGKYTVQVASMTTEQEAQTLSAELKDKGFSVFYVSANVKGKTVYRVNIGLFTTDKEAAAYKKDLLDRKKFESAIVMKVTSTN